MKEDITPLLEFVKKREIIRMAKESNVSPPWTTDPILIEFRFCNVRRRHDRVSRWLLTHVLTEEGIKKNLDTFIQFSALCRMINWPPTIKLLLKKRLYYPGIKKLDWVKIGKTLDEQQKTEKVWTSAYMIHGDPKGGKNGKGLYVTKCLQEGFDAHLPEIKAILKQKKLRPLIPVLSQIKSIGEFLAGQIIADWSYTSLLSDAKDLYKWAPLGPGSRRGYNRLLGLKGRKAIKAWPDEVDFIVKLKQWRKAIIKEMGTRYRDLTLHDVQNCLCEVDKYLRVKNGEGRPKSYYVPETRF